MEIDLTREGFSIAETMEFPPGRVRFFLLNPAVLVDPYLRLPAGEHTLVTEFGFQLRGLEGIKLLGATRTITPPPFQAVPNVEPAMPDDIHGQVMGILRGLGLVGATSPTVPVDEEEDDELFEDDPPLDEGDQEEDVFDGAPGEDEDQDEPPEAVPEAPDPIGQVPPPDGGGKGRGRPTPEVVASAEDGSGKGPAAGEQTPPT